MEAFISTHNCNILCLSETFLDSTIDLNDRNTNSNGYFNLRADHPSNSKYGAICIHLKRSLPLIRRNYLSVVHETIVTEISVDDETYFFTCFYRLPSQHHVELDDFCSEPNLLLTNINNIQPAHSILIGKFNAKCSKWCSSDKTKKTKKAGLEIGNITITVGYGQVINKPTINETSSCIDLIFLPT